MSASRGAPLCFSAERARVEGQEGRIDEKGGGETAQRHQQTHRRISRISFSLSTRRTLAAGNPLRTRVRASFPPSSSSPRNVLRSGEHSRHAATDCIRTRDKESERDGRVTSTSNSLDGSAKSEDGIVGFVEQSRISRSDTSLVYACCVSPFVRYHNTTLSTSRRSLRCHRRRFRGSGVRE